MSKEESGFIDMSAPLDGIVRPSAPRLEGQGFDMKRPAMPGERIIHEPHGVEPLITDMDHMLKAPAMGQRIVRHETEPAETEQSDHPKAA